MASPSRLRAIGWFGYGLCQPQLAHLTSVALHIVPSSGHGCGCGALFGVSPIAGSVHVHVNCPWGCSYFANVFVPLVQRGFPHWMMALGIYTSGFCGSVYCRLMHWLDGVERQREFGSARCLLRCFWHSVLLPAAGFLTAAASLSSLGETRPFQVSVRQSRLWHCEQSRYLVFQLSSVAYGGYLSRDEAWGVGLTSAGLVPILAMRKWRVTGRSRFRN